MQCPPVVQARGALDGNAPETRPPALPGPPGGEARGNLHALPAAEVYAALGTRPQGLTGPEADERLRRHGPNAIRRIRGKPLALVHASQLAQLAALLGVRDTRG